MKIKTLVVGEFQVNCFIISSGPDAAIVIDPGAEPDRILAFLNREKLAVACYLLTHGHMDHISALADLHAAHPAPVAIHAADLNWAFSPLNQMPPFYPVPRRPERVERLIEDGQHGADAGLNYVVMSTPGHTPGSVCFHFPDHKLLFSGDTLFAGSVGRTDFPMSHPDAMTASLAALARLPDDTVVYPGHGPATRMAREKKANPFLQAFTLAQQDS